MTEAELDPQVRREYSRDEALRGLDATDPAWPTSQVAHLLADPRNRDLLRYVSAEAFTHVFPGDETTTEETFYAQLNNDLEAAPAFHLWAEIPLCRYRCHFCQFPIQVLPRDGGRAADQARRWVDANIAEARLWLRRIPALATTPVGEFCLFGGTPSAIPADQLARLVDFYTDAFTFTDQTSLRAEGSPDSLTRETLTPLAARGFRTLTYGIQTFNDELLRLANRRHTAADAEEALRIARGLDFTRVDADLMWGQPGQDVTGFVSDVQRMIHLGFDTIVMIKLHLRSFQDVNTAIGHVSPAPWEDPAVRARIAEQGHRWPSLGEQFQMREAAVQLLHDARYSEHPTTYFPRRDVGPELWRAMNLDQDKQYPQVGIGLGGYTWSASVEADEVVDPATYLRHVDAGQIPFASLTQITPPNRAARAVRMALTTCQPLSEQVHQDRFGDSLLNGRWADTFTDLAERGLLVIDPAAGTLTPTPAGATLVEAIVNTALT